jgi:periplasmic protein TonB
MPRGGERYTLGVLVTGLVYVGAMLAVIRVAASAAPYLTAIGDPGAPGGGGGGGGSVVRYVELPALQRQAGAEVETPPQPTSQPELLLPTAHLKPTIEQETPTAQIRLTGPVVPATRIGQGPGNGGGAGAGTGSGGGIGSGHGTGVGSGEGPGSGGQGGSVVPPDPIGVLIPPFNDLPAAVRGRTFSVEFWVDASGRVTRIDVDPEIEDAAYRRQFMDKMRAFKFRPARTLDGEPVNGRLVVPITFGGSL